MNTYHLIMMFFVFTLFTINTKASTWKKQLNNQIIDETLTFNNKIYVLSHQKKRLNSINQINNLQTLQTRYFITQLNKEGDINHSISFQSTFLLKKAILNSSGDLFILMQSKSRTNALKKVNVKHFDSSLNLVQQSDFVLDKAVDFGRMVYEDNYLYLMGIESDTRIVRLMKLNETLKLEWAEQLNGYPADIKFLNKTAYDIKAHQQKIYVIFNSTKTAQVIGSPPINKNFSGLVACLNDEGDLQWAKKIQYVNTNYFGSQVLNIAHVNNNALWITGNVSPACFEGCPRSVVYKMSLTGDIVSTRSLSPGFYNYINEGTVLANGSLVFHGFSNDDVFAPPPTLSRSHLFVLDENLNQLNHFISNENQINNAQLGQGETVFEKLYKFENNSIVYNTGNFLLRTNLNELGCSELELQPASSTSVAFPNMSNIYINVSRIETINDVFSFAFNSVQNQFTINNICFDAGNTRLSENEAFINWTISPNPSMDYITVNNLEWLNNATYSIYNTAGKLIIKNNLTDEKINVSTLSKGIYYMNIKSVDTHHNTIKFIKQ